MQHILKQIPQSVIEMYNITADETALFISSSNFYGFTNPEIQIEENSAVIKIVGKNYVLTLWKLTKFMHTTFI
jgi:hypothetical protein